MRMIDLPPVWLCLCLVAVWLSPWTAPWGALFWPGMLCLAIAAGLTAAAALAFARARTTIIPHRVPSALVTGGVFRVSRNPIYLADLLILLGVSLIWGKLLGFLLLPVLAIVLEWRFIRPEESRMSDAFGAEFDAYSKRTRRWI